MPYYVKITKRVRDAILPSYVAGTRSADGNVIVFQSDLNGVKGLTLGERAANVGGALLTLQQAKMEIDGRANPPAECHTPEEYGNGSDINDYEESEVTNE